MKKITTAVGSKNLVIGAGSKMKNDDSSRVKDERCDDSRIKDAKCDER